MITILEQYHDAIAQNLLQHDDAQIRAAMALDELIASTTTKKKTSWWPFQRTPDHQSGLYLYGPVGRGKTMMMDWSVKAFQQRGKRAERWHFHAFMLEIHNNLHDQAAHSPALAGRVAALAQQWRARLDVLCFDEFHVTDVADAMIMMPLFTELFKRGVVILTTSNWAPDDLYAGGLQRSRFLPFIAYLKRVMAIVNVTGAKDYRQEKSTAMTGWLMPLNSKTQEEFQQRFRDAVGYDPIETQELHVGMRSWTIPRASKTTAQLDLDQVLSQPVGAADFLALAGRYPMLFLDNLHPFTTDQNERAKRFMVMIDTLYDNKVKLVVRASVPLDQIYPLESRLTFEFSRTASRLKEMTGA